MAAPIRIDTCNAVTLREHGGRQVRYFCTKANHPRGLDHEAVTSTGTLSWRA